MAVASRAPCPSYHRGRITYSANPITTWSTSWRVLLTIYRREFRVFVIEVMMSFGEDTGAGMQILVAVVKWEPGTMFLTLKTDLQGKLPFFDIPYRKPLAGS